MKIYENKAWLYEHYVQRRLNMKDMCEILLDQYNIKISPQGLYNHIKKHDLLKYRGKGRRLGANLQHNKKTTTPSPKKERDKRMRQAMIARQAAARRAR